MNPFNREMVEELRRENQRKGARIRVLTQALVAAAIEREALRRGVDPRTIAASSVTIDDQGAARVA